MGREAEERRAAVIATIVVIVFILGASASLWCLHRMHEKDVALNFYRSHFERANERNSLIWKALNKDGYIIRADAKKIWKETDE